MARKNKSHQHFVDSELFQPNSMEYVELAYERVLEGSDDGLSTVLNHHPSTIKHRQICDQLRNQGFYVDQVLRADSIIDYYRRYGHHAVDLGLFSDRRFMPPAPELEGELVGDFASQPHQMDHHAWHQRLTATYSASVGYEFMHTTFGEQKWFSHLIEANQVHVSQEELITAYEDLARTSLLEKHLGIQFVGQKRFSVEGCEALIPCIERIIKDQVDSGVHDFVIGMPHRGRLGVLINTLGLSVEKLVAEFSGEYTYETTSGDVKYHLGHSVDRVYRDQPYHISLAYNPSHLEAINAVVMGNVRARHDKNQGTAAAIIIHGDGSIAGQGVVMEGLNMSQVAAYHIEGSIHLVANNQIGFTTLPEDARSSIYCTDIAKMIGAPVMHVHADDLPSVIRCAKIASLYRSHFKKDVFIDIVGYRKYGHNEADEPRATQPTMYAKIKEHPGALEIFKTQLIEEGVEESLLIKINDQITQEIKAGNSLIQIEQETKSSRHKAWEAIDQDNWRCAYKSKTSIEVIKSSAQKMLDLTGVHVQKQVENMMKAREEMARGNQPLNWGMAELMAYQVLIDQGHSIRLVGQDVIRGTFSHRHASIFDQDTGERHSLIRDSESAQFYNYNSILSEYAALGFEYGYAETRPNALTIFEAQFGDFINGAQIIIDQFISSGYQKWRRYCGLVMLLPHGYEGQGPEHSSARLERFLQLYAQENIQVCVPSQPKQMYHLLLRQMKRAYRRPLIVFTPKSLLRHPKAISSLEQLADGCFEVVIDDLDQYKTATRLVICSGKIFYDLEQYREEVSANTTALIRLEQLKPFPLDELKLIVGQYKQLQEVVWCQEEPQNQGGWNALREEIQSCIGDCQLRVVSRAEAASPAVGYLAKHREQQMELVKQVFSEERE